ncbi:MAG TPA: protein kinase [Steroidobacteraceae bacterium]|nr:protein kinase [Steroidobacteraceae bacterium]
MSALSAAQRARADELLDVLLDLPEGERADYLTHHGGDDPAVVQEVESLLRATQALGGFLAVPPRLAGGEVPSESVPVGLRVGVWKVIRTIGRGGMGVVYEAVRAEGGFAQRAAIKLLRHEAIAELERFHVERRILARLEHPGIARLYDGGVTPDGRPYMVMELIEGEPITAYCARVRATLTHRTQLFVQVCEAVAYAHRNLVVHRDLKPANILVTAQGQVKLLDFGVAKLITDDRELTRTAGAPLTLSFAAPEQLLGGPVTTATDVYTLGLLLFELLTGTLPWATMGEPIAHAMRIVLERPTPAPSIVAAGLSAPPLPVRLLRGDFDAIVAKATRMEPGHRYETVDALKRDVECALRGDAVAARTGARLYYFGRLLRRYRWAAIAVMTVVLSLAIGLDAAAWQAKRVQIERDVARRDAAREEAVRYELTRLFRTAITARGTGSATAKTMIDDSAERVLREYRDQPQQAGEIVLTLADLYGALEDVNGAGVLLDGFLREADGRADPAVVADARQKFANIELLRGHLGHAAELLSQAEAFWAGVPNRYAEERLEGLGIRAREQRAAGDLDGAIATMRTAIPQRIALSGRVHRETAVLYNSFGIILMTAHRLDEALEAFQRTLSIYKALGLADELDAQIVLGNLGDLEMRTGHLRQGETMLATAIQHERALAGNSAAVAAALGYYGKLLSITNRAGDALPTLTEATNLGAQYTGPSSPLTVRNRLFLGEAQLAAGDLTAARSTLAANRQAAVAQYGASHALTLRTDLALARLAIAEGHGPEAQTQLVALIPLLRRNAQLRNELAQALQSLGEVLAAEGQPRQGIAPLREAVLLDERSRDATWELQVARERLAEALEADGEAGARELLPAVCDSLKAQFGAAHPEVLRAEHALLAAKGP